MYLLDTVILSELRKRRRNAEVVAWVRSVRAANLLLSPVAIGELELGIEKQATNVGVFNPFKSSGEQ